MKVTNTGDRAGEEIVQLYIRDLVGDVVRPLKELKDFVKIRLQPGESSLAEFTINEEQLRYYHADLTFKSDAGNFEVFAGPDSKNLQSQMFELKK